MGARPHYHMLFGIRSDSPDSVKRLVTLLACRANENSELLVSARVPSFGVPLVATRGTGTAATNRAGTERGFASSKEASPFFVDDGFRGRGNAQGLGLKSRLLVLCATGT
jgi:hypothetical protein